MRNWKNTCFGAVIAFALVLGGCKGENGGPTENPQIDGIRGPNVTLVNGFVILSMAFDNVTIDAGATIPIPQYPHSSIQVGPDFQTGGLLVSLNMSVVDFLGNHGEGMDPQSLPGGRPLPGVINGALPAAAVRLPVLNNAIFYVGPEVIGFFVPFSQLDLQGIILTFRFFDDAKNPVGTLSLVGHDANGQNSGILALMHADLLGINGEARRIETLKKFIELGY